MLLVYENKDKGISAEWKKTVHMPPHLHEAIEVVYVTNGNIALGVGMELYNMDEGDFAIVFPNVIHHYQVFGEKENKAIFLYIDPAVLSGFLKELQIYSPPKSGVKKRKCTSGCGSCNKIFDAKSRVYSDIGTGICTNNSCICIH